MTRKSIIKPILLSAVLATSTVGLTGCGYNNLQAQDEQVTASWSEVVNQYQRRSDLVPNLVKVVQQYAKQEQEVFTQVAEASSRAGGITVTPEVLNDPEAMERYAAAQEQMTGALSRLMAVSERYPELKSDALFQDLQAQLEGTENRITVARKDFNEATADYNLSVRTFPANIMAGIFGFAQKELFKATEAAQTAPDVNFDFNKK